MARKGVLGDEVARLLSVVKRKHLLIENEIQNLLHKKEEEISLPVSIFDERLGMLEAASLYLHDELGLRFTEISRSLKRDYKTIWTSYDKGRKKLKNEKQRD